MIGIVLRVNHRTNESKFNKCERVWKTMKVYCDTNVFINYFGKNHNTKLQKDLAYEFFSRGWNCHFELIISDWLLKELRNHLDEKEIQEILEEYRSKNKLYEVHVKKGDWDKAHEISNHPDDALHAILANRADANYLTTQNIKHFNEKCNDLVEVCLPEFI